MMYLKFLQNILKTSLCALIFSLNFAFAYEDIEEIIYSTHDSEFEFESESEDYKQGTKNYSGYYKVGTPYKVLGKWYYPEEDEEYQEIGIASWYGNKFHKKKTANGEIFNMHHMSAAHKTLPLPCVVKVVNLENGRSIKVRINDRGPFVDDRIIDLSFEASKRLDFHNKGTAKVEVTFLPQETEELLAELSLK